MRKYFMTALIVLGALALVQPALANQCCDFVEGCASAATIDQATCEALTVVTTPVWTDNDFCDINTGNCVDKPGGDNEALCAAGGDPVILGACADLDVISETPSVTTWGIVALVMLMLAGSAFVLLRRRADSHA